MAVIVPIRTTGLNPGGRSTRPKEDVLSSQLVGWRPDQLWLSNGCWTRPAQQAMAEAVTTAVDAVLKQGPATLPRLELLRVLRYTRREVAWLRLAARVLRGPSCEASSHDRNLAAAALWVAAVRHDDLLATVECAAEVTGHAIMLEADLVAGETSLPPGIETMTKLASRMRRRGRELLARRLTWPDLDTVGPCLEQALRDDPLRGLSELSRMGGA